jgi:mutator protein MutT
MTAKHCTLLFLIRNDEILLAQKKRGFGAGHWNGVGGKIETNETIEQALVRECQEEIGVTPKTYRKVAEHDFLQQESDPWRMYVHVYLCDAWDGEPQESEEMAPQWFNMSDIPYDDMWSDDEFWLPLVLKGKLLRGNLTFDRNDNLLTHDIIEVTELD